MEIRIPSDPVPSLHYSSGEASQSLNKQFTITPPIPFHPVTNTSESLVTSNNPIFTNALLGIWQELIRAWKSRYKIHSLIRKFTKLLPLFFHFESHQKIVRELTLLQENIFNLYPQLALKYLKNYLALSFSRKTRAAILINHYRYLNTHVVEDFLNRIYKNPPILWSEEKDNIKYDIVLTFPRVNDNEGDLSLKFVVNNSNLYTLSFSIIPGSIVDSPLDQLLYIGQMQGAANSYPHIREATKALFENTPQAILLSAAQGIAMALNISGICGVSAKNQVTLAVNRSLLESFEKTYDEFWLDNSASQPNNLFFHLPIPLIEKPISLIKRNHRPRVLRKRQFKQQIKNCVFEIFQGELLEYAKQKSFLAGKNREIFISDMMPT